MAKFYGNDTFEFRYSDNKPRAVVKELIHNIDGSMTLTLEGNSSDFINEFTRHDTIVIWANGEKTIVKAQDGEPSKNELYRSHKEEIKRVIFNEPYTIVIWANGEKTIVKAQDGEPYDKEKGLAMCFAKYTLGNTCRYFDFFKDICDNCGRERRNKNDR